MIEFKAECGHTVRAKDDDAGGMVRCSYCGKEAAVPDEKADDFDFLFQDIQQESDGRPRKRRRRPGAGLWGTSKSAKGIDPFAVILKLCYAAALITVVIVVGKEYIIPLIQQGGPTSTVTQGPTDAAGNATTPTPPRKRRGRSARDSDSKGLIGGERIKGLYVSSTPPGALGFFINADRAPESGRINKIKGCVAFRVGDPSDAHCTAVKDGTYVVEVALPWNHRGLKDLPHYREFRRSIEDAGDSERRRLVQHYFLPDETESNSDVFIDQTDDQIYIVRQYRDVEVRNHRSRGVLALFLPRVLKKDRKSIAVEELATRYIPDGDHFTFEEDDVREELDYYQVAPEDQPFVLRALRQIGAIPYVTPDGKTRLFRINIHDGVFSAKIIRRSKR